MIATQAGVDAGAVTFNVTSHFSDPDAGDVLTYSATGLPPGLSINAAGVITGTIDHSASLTGPYAVTVTATDILGLTTSQSFTWTVSNPAPVANNDAVATLENTAASGSVFANNGSGVDSDPDGDAFTVAAVNGLAGNVGASVAGSTGGAFTINSDGSYAFNPGTAFDNLAAGQTRTTTVSYTISDGEGGTSIATVTVTVTGVNDNPVANADSFTVAEDGASTIAVKANDSDIDGNPLTITAVNGLAIAVGSPVAVTNGTVSLTAAGTLTFTPTANYNGPASFTYTISDGAGGSATATVSGTVTPVNDAPVAVSDGPVAGTEDTALTIPAATLLANDTDIDGDSLVITSVQGALHGSVTLVGGNVVFTPTANYNGPASFTYTVSDGNGGTSTATVNLTIGSVNDAPSGTNKTATVTEDATYTFSGSDFGFSDVNDNPAPNTLASVIITTVPGNGVLSLSGVPVTAGQVITAANLSSLTWTPAANANGTGLASFTFQVVDNGGTANGGVDTDPVPNTFTFNVTAANDAPILAVPLADQSVNEDTLVSFTIPAGSFTDVDSSLSYTATLSSGGALPAWLTFNAATQTFSGTPPLNFNGTLSLRVTASDGALTASDTFLLTVNPVNDAPSGANKTVVLNEDTTYSFAATDFGFSDVSDNPAANTLQSVIITTVPGNGVLSLSGVPVTAGEVISAANLANLTWAPAANANGTGLASFTFQVVDNGGTANGGIDTDASPNTITFNVSAVNDAPVAVDDTNAGGDHTTLSGNVILGTISSGTGVGGADTDVDGNVLHIVSVSNGVTTAAANNPLVLTYGTLTLNSNGSYTFIPNALANALANGVSVTQTVTYTVADPSNAADTAILTFTITGGNDAPVVNPPIPDQSVNEDTPWAYQVPAGTFDDVDSPVLTFSATLSSGAPLPAWLSFNVATQTFSGTPPLNFNGSIGLRVTASDGLLSAFDDFVLKVNPVNDAPVVAIAIPDQAINEDTAWSYKVPAGSFTDVDNATLSYTATLSSGAVLPSWLNFNAATQTFSGTPPADFNGTIALKVTASDGSLTASDNFVLTINPVNDAPVAHDGTATTLQNTPISAHVPVATDVDGDTLTYGNGATVPTHGTVVVQPNGSYIYTPVNGFSGTDTFTYTVTDGTVTVEKTVTVTVHPFNTAPVAVDDHVTIPGGKPAVINVLGNDKDADGDPLHVEAVTASSGTVSINPDGTLNYRPATGFSGQATITYWVTDGQGGHSQATVTVNVSPPVLPVTPVKPVHEDEIGSLDTPPVPKIIDRGPVVQTVSVDGAVVDAVHEIGGMTSIADSIGTDGVVVKAANRIESLQGLSELSGGGSIVAQGTLSEQRLHQLAQAFAPSIRSVNLNDWNLQSATGFSLRFNITDNCTLAHDRVELVFESMVREHSLVLHFTGIATDPDVEVLEYRVTQADGKPLPFWLDRAGRDAIFGKWPVSVEEIELNVTAILSDGQTISRQIRVQTNSGEIQPIDKQKLGWVPRTFTDELRMHASSQASEVQKLAAVLGR